MNFESTYTYVKKETPNSTNFKFDILALEEKIRQGGVVADIEKKKMVLYNERKQKLNESIEQEKQKRLETV